MADRALMEGYQRGSDLYHNISEKAASMEPYLEKADNACVKYCRTTKDAISGMAKAGKNGWTNWKKWIEESPSKNGAITLAAIEGPSFGATDYFLNGSPFWENQISPITTNPLVTHYLQNLPEPVIIGGFAALATAAFWLSIQGAIKLGKTYEECHNENKARKFSKIE